MKVKQLTKYEFKGKEYSSLLDVKEEIHNTIGLEVLDSIKRNCPLAKHKDYHVLLDLLCSSEIRNVLIECLNVTFEQYDEYSEEHRTINILDIKK